MADRFCSDFLANLASNVVVLLLGIFTAWMVGKRLNIWEQAQQRKREKAAEIEKAVRYLEFLKEEVEDISKELPGMTKAFEATGFGTLVSIRSSCWEVLLPSGELPKVIGAGLLQSLARFYGQMAHVNRMQDYISRAWLAPHRDSVPGMKEKMQAGVIMTVRSLKEAQKLGATLPNDIDKEIKRLSAELDTA